MTEQPSATVERSLSSGSLRQEPIWREVFEGYVARMNAKDLAGVIDMYHEASPIREIEKQKFAHIFSSWQCTGQLLEARYVGQEGEYVLVFVKQRGANLDAPPELRERVDSSIVACRRDGAAWKIWSMMYLEADSP